MAPLCPEARPFLSPFEIYPRRGGQLSGITQMSQSEDHLWVWLSWGVQERKLADLVPSGICMQASVTCSLAAGQKPLCRHNHLLSQLSGQASASQQLGGRRPESARKVKLTRHLTSEVSVSCFLFFLWPSPAYRGTQMRG